MVLLPYQCSFRSPGCQRDPAAGQHHRDLAFGQLVGQLHIAVAAGVFRVDGSLDSELVTQAVEPYDVTLADALVVVGVVELQREDPEVGQVLPVNAGEGLGDDHLQAQITRGDHGVLTRGALAVVLPGDDDVRAGQAAHAPAGRISSVEILSPSFSSTGASTQSGSMSKSGMDAMFGLFTRGWPRASPAGTGATSIEVLTCARSGSSRCG